MLLALPTKKRVSSKKRKKPGSRTSQRKQMPTSTYDDDFDDEFVEKPSGYDPYMDNIILDEQENMDLLNTIDGIDYDEDQFNEDFPHLSAELKGHRSAYPMESVRWEDEDSIQEEILPSEEPDITSLLRRSKTESEALEIIKYFERIDEISPREADKLKSLLKSKGLSAFRRKKK